MFYAHSNQEFHWCEKCESLEALAKLSGKSFVPCRKCWERYVLAHEPEIDELL